MRKEITKLIDKLIENSQHTFALKALEKLFNNNIPFNKPHKFKFVEMADKSTRLSLPLIRVNKNHLGGMHACAIATLGEYPAGLTLIKYFGSTRYRIVMAEINIKYLKQAKTDLIGHAEITDEDIAKVESELNTEKKSTLVVKTNILNTSDEVVAEVYSTWQLKDWDAVSFKS